MKIEKPANCSQDSEDNVNSKASSTSKGTLSDLNEGTDRDKHGKEDGDREFSLCGYKSLSKHSDIDAVDARSSIEINCLNDGEGSEYSSLKNDLELGNLEQKCKVNSRSDDGINTSGQPKSESSPSNVAKFVLPSSHDSYQGSVIGARTFKGTGATNANSSSMSSTSSDSGYHHKKIHVSNVESVTTQESMQLEKLTDDNETEPSMTRSSELAEKLVTDINLEADRGKGHLSMGEPSGLSGIDLNEDTTNSNEAEQQTVPCVKNVKEPVAIFARCVGHLCESTAEIGFKGGIKSVWQGSTSSAGAFWPTCQSKGSDTSGQKWFTEIDLNVEASGMEIGEGFLDQKVSSEEACSAREKFDIDLNIYSENDEDMQSSRSVRDFDLNDDPMTPDLNVQSVEGLLGKEVIHSHETCSPWVSKEPEPHYTSPVFLPRMTSLPFVLRVPEQIENATREFPFHTPHHIEPQNNVFSLASSLHVPFYPAHLNGVPAFQGVPRMVEFSGGPASNNQYEGINHLGSASSRGIGVQLFATPMHPIVPQQLNDFRRRALPSLTPMKRREPETRWNSH
ncbi:hypothetical protein SAY87_019749 [Trapa incisa]|uniref:Uncharacterized protein n=1 Tax=Trapa incisa TaxID=236973 RepID=A0AAN7Q349_9MYRT|nr:hypothetical protein SAY87_019749 [Trapa incisa]